MIQCVYNVQRHIILLKDYLLINVCKETDNNGYCCNRRRYCCDEEALVFFEIISNLRGIVQNGFLVIHRF